MSFRFSNSDDENTADESSFADALRARFGEDNGEDADPAPVESSGGDEGSSPLPSSPPQSDEPDVEAEDSVDGDQSMVAGEGEEILEEAVETDPLGDSGGEASEDTAPTVGQAVGTTNDDLDLNELFTRHYGTKPTAESMVALLGFVDQVQRLTPEQQAALGAILQGEMPAAQPANPQPQPYTTSPDFPNLEELDPSARAILEPIVKRQEQLEAEIRAQQTAAAQQNLQAQQQAIVAGISAASSAFVQDYANILSPTDLVILETKVQQSGLFPQFMAQHNNDPAQAYRSLLETIAYSDPDLRKRLVAATVTPEQEAKESTRKQKAAAVSAGGVAGRKVSPLTPSPDEPASNDPNAVREWAINEVARKTGLARRT